MASSKHSFFDRETERVARDLLGKLLVRRIDNKYYVGKIVETEAYLPNDNASHASAGLTKRNAPMFGPAGHTYIYFTYGMHWLLNFVAEKRGTPSAVLIRAVEPLVENDKSLMPNAKVADFKKLGSGPARLTKWMQIDDELNNIDIAKSDLLIVADDFKIGNLVLKSEKVTEPQIVAVPRVGIDYAGEYKNLPLRFYIKGNPFISRK